MSGETAHVDGWFSVAWAMPADVDVEGIAEDALQAAFGLIHARLEDAGYPAFGDISPGEAYALDGAFQTFVRMVALNNNEVAALQDLDED